MSATATMDGARAITPVRRWAVLAMATTAMQFAWWPVVYEVAASPDPEGGSAGGFAFGLALVPVVFGILAFGSRRDDAPMAVLRAMGIFLVVGLPLGLMDVVVGLAVGFSAAAVTALRGPEGLDTKRLRWFAVGGLLVWVSLLLAVAPGFAIMSGAVLPLLVHGIVDQAAEDRAHASAR